MSGLQWHEPTEHPGAGEVVIIEVWGRNGRTNLVGYGQYNLYSDDVDAWHFTEGGHGGMLDGEYPTDRICRWARFPEPSWVEP